MIDTIRAGLEARRIRDVVRLYLVSLSLLCPLAVLLWIIGGIDTVFRVLPIIVALLVALEYLTRLGSRKAPPSPKVRLNVKAMLSAARSSLSTPVLIFASIFLVVVSVQLVIETLGGDNIALSIGQSATSARFGWTWALSTIGIVLFLLFLYQYRETTSMLVAVSMSVLFIGALLVYLISTTSFSGLTVFVGSKPSGMAVPKPLGEPRHEHLAVFIDASRSVSDANRREALAIIAAELAKDKADKVTIWTRTSNEPRIVSGYAIPESNDGLGVLENMLRERQKQLKETEAKSLLLQSLVSALEESTSERRDSLYSSLARTLALLQNDSSHIKHALYVYSEHDEHGPQDLSRLADSLSLGRRGLIDNTGVPISVCVHGLEDRDGKGQPRKLRTDKEWVLSYWRSLFTKPDQVTFLNCVAPSK